LSAKIEKPADVAENDDGADNPDDVTVSSDDAAASAAAVESPGAESPGVESPGAESPGTESSGAESPGAESSDSDEDQAPADESDSETDQNDASETPRAKRSWRRIARVAAIVLLFLAPVTLSAFLGWQLWQKQQVTRASQEAQQAAVSYAQVLTSIDSNKVDENFNQVLDGSTGEFKDMYSKSSMQLRQLLIDNKATAHGVVQDSAVQSATKDKVVVLLFVDQAVSNMNMPDPRIDRSRMKMTMEYVDGRWRASKVELP